MTDGSTMSANFEPNGACAVAQVNPLFGINIMGTGRWLWLPALSNLQIQGMVQGGMPFALSLFITGRSGKSYTGYGSDGHGYQFDRSP